MVFGPSLACFHVSLANKRTCPRLLEYCMKGILKAICWGPSKCQSCPKRVDLWWLSGSSFC